MAPSDNILKIFTSGSIFDILNYYLSCKGYNPVGTYVDDSITANNNLYNTTQYATIKYSAILANKPKCLSVINQINAGVLSITTPLTDLKMYTECSPINKVWNDVVNKGFCTSGFTGLFEIWICLFVVSVFFFVVLCFASVLFVQFEAVAEAETGANFENINYSQSAQTGLEMTQYEEPPEESFDFSPQSPSAPKYNTYGVLV